MPADVTVTVDYGKIRPESEAAGFTQRFSFLGL